MVSEPESENGQAYATMRSLFDHTKRVYTVKHAFLQTSDLEITDSSQVDIIRKANLASFVSSIFGSQEIGFAELNEHFLDVFVPEGGRLLKVQGALYLELKTQAFIAAMNSKSRTRTQLLCELFPDDIEKRLTAKRTGTKQLAPSETDFVNRLTSRREILLNDINNEEALKALPDKYHWEHFLRDLSSYISKNFDAINAQQVSSNAPRRLVVVNAYARKRNPSKGASHPVPMEILRSHLARPIKDNFLLANRWKFRLIATCTAISLLVLLALRKLLYKAMAYDDPSNNPSNSINTSNNRPLLRLANLLLSTTLKHHSRSSNPSSSRNTNPNRNRSHNRSRSNTTINLTANTSMATLRPSNPHSLFNNSISTSNNTSISRSHNRSRSFTIAQPRQVAITNSSLAT